MSNFTQDSHETRTAYPGMSDPLPWKAKIFDKERNNKPALMVQKRKAIAKRRRRRFLFGKS